MRTRGIRTIVLVGAVTAMLALTGCGIEADPVVTRLPSDGSGHATTAPSTPTSASTPTAPAPIATPTANSPVASAGDCGGAPITLTAGSETLALSGDCPDVQVQGSALVVDTSNASVGALSVSGDRIQLNIGAAASLTVLGNDAVVSATTLGTLTLRGDRNAVVVGGALASVGFEGNDNSVRANGGVASVNDAGARNAVG